MPTIEDLDSWRAAALEQWTDARIVNADYLDAVIWFFEHSYADLAKVGAELVGVSFNQKESHWLMVVKLKQDGIRVVGFVSSSTPTRCMWRWRESMRKGSWPTYPDRYA